MMIPVSHTLPPTAVSWSRPPAALRHIAILAIASIFTGALVVSQDAPFLNGPVILGVSAAFMCLLYNRFVLSRDMALVLAVLLIHGLVMSLMGFNTLESMSRTYITTFFFLIVFYNITRHADQLHYVLQLYLFGVKFVCWTVLFQLMMFYIGPTFLYDYTWLFNNWVLVPTGPLGVRPSGILYEPSQIGLTCALGISLATARIIGSAQDYLSLRSAVLILAAVIVSMSTLAYVVIMLTVVFLAKSNPPRLIYAMPVVLILLLFHSFGTFDFILERLAGVWELFILNDTTQNANASSFSLFAHFQIAKQVLVESYLAGGGIGSHALSYETFNDHLVKSHNILQIGTAGNLLNRLISELGILGIVLIIGYCIILLRTIIRFERAPLALFAAIAILPFLARNGTYSYYGLAFYICLLMQTFNRAPNTLPLGLQPQG